MQIDNMAVPAGAGYKYWRGTMNPFLDPPTNRLAEGDDGYLDIGGGAVMGTINELNTTDTLADDDKLVMWKDAGRGNAGDHGRGCGDVFQPCGRPLPTA
jgi:hypothetical protein